MRPQDEAARFRGRVEDVRQRIAAACAAAGRAPDSVQLLAIGKGHPAGAVRDALSEGLNAFGENRVQELAAKAAELRDTAARWHLVGSLQTNKVNALLRVEGLELVHSLDREELALALQDRLARAGRSLDVLLQVEATGEP